jgi:acetate kinase
VDGRLSIVVFNAGSSSLKFGLYDSSAAPLARGSLDWAGSSGEAELVFALAAGSSTTTRPRVRGYREAVTHALATLRDAAGTITAIGQRVVHGGARFSAPTRIDAEVKAEISRLAELAPLHNPAALESIDAAEAALPGVPQVAVFDTSFYSTLSAAHHVYPLPYEWFEQWGIRRFGFHGISHSYCVARASELLAPSEPLNIITCHLGNGCSATACRRGTAVATTMGFTPMDGLMMGTRPGSVDPGILTHVQKQRGLTAVALEDVLNHGSGLKGVSGISSDYREVEKAATAGNERASLALEMYAGRVREAVGALAVTLGRVDALVFTAGVGEHSATLRAAVSSGLQCLGLRLDAHKNLACTADADVATDDSAGRILVIRTEEELTIAREVSKVLGASREQVPA